MSITINSTYVGTDSGQFVSPVLKAGRTLAVPGVTIKNNVNYKSRINKLTLAGLVKDATCAFDSAGTVTLDEVWLEVKHLEVNLELCKDDLIPDFLGSDMGCDDSMPEDFLNYLLGEIGSHIADDIETKIWQGTAIANSFPGYEVKFRADAGVVKATGEIAAAADTILAEMRKLTAAASSAILGKSDTYFYVSSKSYQAIRESNNDKAGASPCGEDCVSVDGIKVFHAPGMSDNSMALAQKSNLFFGTWESSDKTNVGVKDMGDQLERNVRFAACFFAGVNYAVPAEIVFYDGADIV